MADVHGRNPLLRQLTAVVTAALVVTACSSGDDADEPIEPIVTQPLTEETAPDDELDDAEADEAPPADDGQVPDTDEPVDGTDAPSTTIDAPDATEPPPDEPPPTTAAPTTTTTTTTIAESIAVQELLLSEEGLGSSRFGADPDGVITYVSSILGSVTGDTGWVDPFTFADCSFANESRRVDWGVLSLIFTDASPYANGRQHFIGWEYGLVGSLGDEPQGLRTAEGITLGTRVVDLLAQYPEMFIVEGEEDLAIPAAYYLNDDFNGLLTGTADDDIITVMTGGVGCFGG